MRSSIWRTYGYERKRAEVRDNIHLLCQKLCFSDRDSPPTRLRGISHELPALFYLGTPEKQKVVRMEWAGFPSHPTRKENISSSFSDKNMESIRATRQTFLYSVRLGGEFLITASSSSSCLSLRSREICVLEHQWSELIDSCATKSTPVSRRPLHRVSIKSLGTVLTSVDRALDVFPPSD